MNINYRETKAFPFDAKAVLFNSDKQAGLPF